MEEDEWECETCVDIRDDEELFNDEFYGICPDCGYVSERMRHIQNLADEMRKS